jgi:lipopolysaccharide/colanic/teichoic acid biosynthesis glycosyltransferase
MTPAERAGLDILNLNLPYYDKHDGTSFYANHIKRVFDLALALVLFIACLPLVLLTAIFVALDGHGSPIFRQKRVGISGKPFDLYKLRTMRAGAEAHGFKTEAKDARITRFGEFLRQSKIDELPQLWNIIRGDMSLIGPRPLSVEETAHIINDLNFATATAGVIPTVLPGLTGLEQCYRQEIMPYEKRFYLNSYYEKNQCAWLDFWVFRRSLLACPTVCLLVTLFAGIEVGLFLAPYLPK